jgi:choline-sulfatase
VRIPRVAQLLLVLAAACSRGAGTAPVPTTSSAGAGAASVPVIARGTAPESVENVLLVSIDSLRADMPWNGYERPIAPNLTALEKTCVSYTHAYSISSYTSMSIGGLLGGRLPSEIKRDGFFFGIYPASNTFFPELLSEAGVQTLSAHAHGYFAGAGFQQGFDKWEMIPNLKFNPQTDENVTSPEHEALAEKLLLSVPEGKRFFAWFHFLDPHDQYMSHQDAGVPSYGKKLRDQYDGEVEFTDRYVGKLIDFARDKPWWSKTALIITSDHGEGLGEHGHFRHGFEVYENLVRVPLFICMPGRAARRIDAKRSAVDLAPTILEMMKLPSDPHFSGTSLLKEVLGGPAEDHDVVVDLPATSNNDKRRALLHEDYKIIGFGESMYPKVFNLKTDPGENNALPRSDPAFSDMQKRLAAFNKTLKEIPASNCGKGCLEGTK